MPDINMQHFGELQRNQHSIDVEIDASQVASPQQDFPMMLETPNSSNSVLNVVAINELGEQLPTEIEGVANDKNWVHLKDLVQSVSNNKMKVFYGGCVEKPAVDSKYGSRAVWDSYFKLVMHMNNNPNGDVVNSIIDSTNNNHGTPVGSMTTGDLVDANYGKAIALDDVDDYITTTSLFATGSQDRTIEIYVKPNTVVYDTLLSYGTQSTGQRVSFRYDSGALRVELEGGGTTSSLTPIAEIYSYQVLRLTGTILADWDLFLNDSKESAIGSLSINTGTSTGVKIGYSFNSGDKFDGTFSEVRLSNISRSDNYISTISNNLNNPTARGINPFYKSISKEHNFVESLQSLGRAG